MEAELGVPVVQHDDGSRDAMHDLEVIYGNGSRAAVEIRCAVDREQTEFWNVVNGRGRWIESDLVGGWFVLAKPNARQLRRQLPPFLRSLERAGLSAFPSYRAEPSANVVDPPRGVVRASQNGTDFPGSIYVQPDLPNEQIAAFMSDTSDAVADWLGVFLHDDACRDVREKLARSGVAERHAFVVVSGLNGLPFAVAGLLLRDDVLSPTTAPVLPPEITDVWIASVWDRGYGLRWSSTAKRWHTFSKHPLRS